MDDPERGSDGHPARDPIVADGERHVGTEGPARQDQRLGCDDLLGQRANGRLDVEPLEVAVVVGAGAALDATEVEPQAGHAARGQGLEEGADHERPHRSAVLRVRVAEHHPAARSLDSGQRELGFQRQAVVGAQHE